MKVLVTGCHGQLGSELVRQLTAQQTEVIGVDREDFDITSRDAVHEALTKIRPDVIIHCAAYTAVDRAETEPALCCQINAEGTLNMARAAQELGAKLVYISTDYVFTGDGDTPFEVNSRPGPLSVYGQSKLQGEIAVQELLTRYFIVRTSWVFGEGKNFVRTMLRLGADRQEITVVDDQVGSPTWTRDLASLICMMIRSDRYGVYHATNEGFCSWCEFAQAIMRLAGLSCEVKPIHTADYHQSLARRPLNSRLSKASLDAAGFPRLPGWEDALARYLFSENVI